MVESTIYIRKPFEVEAVKVTEDNLEEVREWCQGRLEQDSRPYIKVRVARALNERQTKAYPGDWVLYAGTGFKVYTAKAFHKTFEKKVMEGRRESDQQKATRIAESVTENDAEELFTTAEPAESVGTDN